MTSDVGTTSRAAYWDAAFDNRAAVPEFQAYFDDWRERSRRVRAHSAARLDCRYGPAPRALFDWLPAAKPRRPTVVFIHGGYWQFNTKAEFAFTAEGLLQSQINVALLGYSLAPQKRLSEIVAEIAAGCRAVSESLDAFGAGREWILAGWSAGAHLAATQLDHPRLLGALLISGIYDLAPVQRCYLNAALDLTARDINELSPIRRAPRSALPVVLSYGGLELPELQRQSEDCAAVWSRSALNIRVSVIPLAHHYSVLEALAQPGGALLTQVQDLLAAGTT